MTTGHRVHEISEWVDKVASLFVGADLFTSPT
jgi:hypothetical protein